MVDRVVMYSVSCLLLVPLVSCLFLADDDSSASFSFIFVQEHLVV
jgi:hypothetical protein